jgi:hypothetical protein
MALPACHRPYILPGMSNPTVGTLGVMGMMANGNADWFEEVMKPLLAEFREFPRFQGDFPQSCRQRKTRSGAMNAFFGYAIAGIGLYLLKKAADDWYDVSVKPRLKKVFEAFDKKVIPTNKRARKVFILSVWHEQYNVVISVAVIDDDFDQIVAQLDQVGVVQRNALAAVESGGVLAPVHLYTIEAGRVNTKPELLERVDELLHMLPRQTG